MKTLFVGQNSIHIESVDSTNSYASEMLRQIALPEGSVVYTFNQQKGRGQRGSSWESEPNMNVALSLVLYPKFLASDKQFLLTKTASLAVADLMSEILDGRHKNYRVKIKWPNDIYVNERKIAGILIENTLRESLIQNSVIGIGLNVNQVEFGSSIKAVSLAELTGKEFSLMQVQERLLEFLEARYLQLKANKLETLDNAYLERLYRKGVWAEYISSGQTFEGKITGVSSTGKLRMELTNSEVREFDMREIVFT